MSTDIESSFSLVNNIEESYSDLAPNTRAKFENFAKSRPDYTVSILQALEECPAYAKGDNGEFVSISNPSATSLTRYVQIKSSYDPDYPDNLDLPDMEENSEHVQTALTAMVNFTDSLQYSTGHDHAGGKKLDPADFNHSERKNVEKFVRTILNS